MDWKFLLAIVLLVYVPAVYCQGPIIVDAIHPEVKNIGETAFLNCTVARLDKNAVTWTHTTIKQPISHGENIIGKNEDIDGQPKFQIKVRRFSNGDRITYMLIIRGLQRDDAGNYTCAIEIQGKNSQLWPRARGNLLVQVPPKILRSSTTRMEAKVGETIKLQCFARGIPRPNITWVRANGEVLPNMEFSHRGEYLTLENLRRSDQGVYRCVADNTIRPPDQHDARLLLFGKPVVQSVQNTVGQRANGQYSAKLECKISAYPDAVLRWYKKTSKERALITDDDKYDIQKLQSSTLKLSETWYYLKVKNIQANDFGDYYCEGSNSQGTAYTTIKLFETFECQGPNCPSSYNSKATIIHSYLINLVTFVVIFFCLSHY